MENQEFSLQFNISSELELTKLREKFKEEDFRNQDHSSLFTSISHELTKASEGNVHSEVYLLNILRILRNCCVHCHSNQNALLETEIPSTIFQCLLDTGCLSDKLCTCALQFVGNFVAGNTTTQNYIFELTYPDLFINYLTGRSSSVDENHFTICSMVLYNCLNEDRVKLMLTNSEGVLIITSLCESLDMFSGLDWVVLCIDDYFLKNPCFLPLVLSECSFSAQHHVLEMYCDRFCVENSIEQSLNPSQLFTCFADHFLQRYENPPETSSDAFLFSTSTLLKALCWVTAFPGHWAKQANVDRIVCAITNLLADVTGENCKSSGASKNLVSHLALSQGKRDLVRLVGNLCFENSSVQNQIRMLGGVSLVLQACNIDDESPFLQQWAIFAIRNLCQNNPLNQAEIEKLEKLAIADSPVLKSMGLSVVQGENGKLRVIPLKKP